MTAIKTESNQPGAGYGQLPDDEIADLRKRLDHLDYMLHLVEQQTAAVLAFVEEQRPTLARATALMDPGSKLRGMMGRKGRDHAGEGQ